MSRDYRNWPLDCKVFFGNLDYRIDRRDIEDECKQFGSVRDVWVAYDPPGFAFVHFDKAEAATRAVEKLDGICLFGSRIRVQHGQERRPTRRSPSRDRYARRQYSRDRSSRYSRRRYSRDRSSWSRSRDARSKRKRHNRKSNRSSSRSYSRSRSPIRRNTKSPIKKTNPDNKKLTDAIKSPTKKAYEPAKESTPGEEVSKSPLVSSDEIPPPTGENNVE